MPFKLQLQFMGNSVVLILWSRKYHYKATAHGLSSLRGALTKSKGKERLRIYLEIEWIFTIHSISFGLFKVRNCRGGERGSEHRKHLVALCWANPITNSRIMMMAVIARFYTHSHSAYFECVYWINELFGLERKRDKSKTLCNGIYTWI